MTRDDESKVQTISFQVGPDLREVVEEGVEALDRALAEVGSGEVMHLVDPRRINSFQSGGPPTWSVASVPVGDDTYFVTYGNSQLIDPSREGVRFELAIRVKGETGMWPGLLLRGLVRYMLGSGRELEVGQYMPLPDALTRFAVAPEEREAFPATEMNTAIFAQDPLLPRVSTPTGEIEIRRVIGLYPEELQLAELWSIHGFAGALQRVHPDLEVDVGRVSLLDDADFVANIEAGSQREGSSVGFVAVPSVQWGETQDGRLAMHFPGGEHGARVARMIAARLPHGRHLLVHDTDPDNQSAIAFEPGEGMQARIDHEVLVLSLPADHPLIVDIASAPPEGLTITLG
jgi:hypothetical protein